MLATTRSQNLFHSFNHQPVQLLILLSSNRLNEEDDTEDTLRWDSAKNHNNYRVLFNKT